MKSLNSHPVSPAHALAVRMLPTSLQFGNSYSVFKKGRATFLQRSGVNLCLLSLLILLIFVVPCLLKLRVFWIQFFSNTSSQYPRLFLSAVAKLQYSVTQRREQAKGALLKNEMTL